MLTVATASPKQTPVPNRPEPPTFTTRLLSLFLTSRPLPPALLPRAQACVHEELQDVLGGDDATFRLIYSQVVHWLKGQNAPTFAAELIQFVELGLTRWLEQDTMLARDGQAPLFARITALANLICERRAQTRAHKQLWPCAPLPKGPAGLAAPALGQVAQYHPLTWVKKGPRQPRPGVGDKTLRPLSNLQGEHLGFFSPALRRGTYSKLRLFASADQLRMARSTRLPGTPGALLEPTHVERYLDEQQILAQSGSPMAPSGRLCDQRGRLYDLVPVKMGDGDDLLDVFPGLPETLLWEAFRALVDALGALHAKHFVHLDIKPNNLLWDSHSGFVLSDYGLARPVGAPGFWVGTLGYLAPELTHSRSDRASTAADIFSLGMTLLRFVAPQEAAAVPWSSVSHGESQPSFEAPTQDIAMRTEKARGSLTDWHHRRVSRGLLNLSGVSADTAGDDGVGLWDRAALAVQARTPALAELIFARLLSPTPAARPSVEQLASWLTGHGPTRESTPRGQRSLHFAAATLPFTQLLNFWRRELIFAAGHHANAQAIPQHETEHPAKAPDSAASEPLAISLPPWRLFGDRGRMRPCSTP